MSDKSFKSPGVSGLGAQAEDTGSPGTGELGQKPQGLRSKAATKGVRSSSPQGTGIWSVLLREGMQVSPTGKGTKCWLYKANDFYILTQGAQAVQKD